MKNKEKYIWNVKYVKGMFVNLEVVLIDQLVLFFVKIYLIDFREK